MKLRLIENVEVWIIIFYKSLLFRTSLIKNNIFAPIMKKIIAIVLFSLIVTVSKAQILTKED